jgi:hypothetical protein
MNRINEISQYLDGNPCKTNSKFAKIVERLHEHDYRAFVGFLKNQDASEVRLSFSSKRVASVLDFLSYYHGPEKSKALNATDDLLFEAPKTRKEIESNRSFWFNLDKKVSLFCDSEVQRQKKIHPNDPRRSNFMISNIAVRDGYHHKKIGHS